MPKFRPQLVNEISLRSELVSRLGFVLFGCSVLSEFFFFQLPCASCVICLRIAKILEGWVTSGWGGLLQYIPEGNLGPAAVGYFGVGYFWVTYIMG